MNGDAARRMSGAEFSQHRPDAGAKEKIPSRAANDNEQAQGLRIVPDKAKSEKNANEGEKAARPESAERPTEGLTGAPADIARAIEHAPARTVMFIGNFTGKAGSKQLVDTRGDARSYAPKLQEHFQPKKEGVASDVVVVSAQQLREMGVGESGEGWQEAIRRISEEEGNRGKKILADIDPTTGIASNAWTTLQREFPHLATVRGADAEAELARWFQAQSALPAGKEPPAGQPSVKKLLEALPAGVQMWQQIRAKLGNRPLIDASPLDPFHLALIIFAEKKRLTGGAVADFVNDPHRSKEGVGFAYFGEQEKVRGAYGDSARRLG